MYYAPHHTHIFGTLFINYHIFPDPVCCQFLMLYHDPHSQSLLTLYHCNSFRIKDTTSGQFSLIFTDHTSRTPSALRHLPSFLICTGAALALLQTRFPRYLVMWITALGLACTPVCKQALLILFWKLTCLHKYDLISSLYFPCGGSAHSVVIPHAPRQHSSV